MKRIYSIDVVRGMVMVIMALDDVRDLLHTTSLTDQPTNLNTTTPALFFTRWITHLCAPTFVFLAGVSAFLSQKHKNDRGATRRFLLTRGLWLIVLEFTLVNFGLWFDIHFKLFVFNVIATIGVGFILLSLLLRCSAKTIAIIGLCILVLYNLAILLPMDNNSFLKQIFSPLFFPGAFPFAGGRLFVIGYPPIPWLGIMLLGFACGPFFERETHQQRSLFLQLSIVSIGLFLLLRFINVYGDFVPWKQQKNSLFTFLSFINLTKYPPSLDFGLLFLGIMLLLLSRLTGVTNKWTGVLRVYGKTPLFYFVVHWYLIHPLVFMMVWWQGFTRADMVFGFNFGRPLSGSGLGLGAIYLVWLGIVAVMYPLCKWYGAYKEKHPEKKWLRYL